MAFGIQSHHRAELRVEVGKTSLEELQKFHDEALGKGGGEVRGKKNSDGSHTLYVVQSGRKGTFESAKTREGKRDLGKTLVAEIISRRVPSGPEGSASNATVKGLLSKGNKDAPTSLNSVLKQARTDTAAGISDKAKAGFKNIDNALSTPAIKDAFRASLPPQDQAKVDFLAKSKEFAKAKDFSVKVGLAKEMSELAGKMGLPARQTEILQATFEEFEFVHKPGQELDDVGKRKLAELTQKFDAAGVTAKEALNVKLDTFSRTPEFQSAAAIAYPQLAFAEDGARPETYLLPGSGEEFQKNVKTAKEGLSTVGQLLSAEPEMRGAFEGHVKAQDGGQEALDELQAVNDLITESGNPGLSDDDMLGKLEAQFGDTPDLQALKQKVKDLAGPEDDHFFDIDQPPGDLSTGRGEINKFLAAQKKEATDVLAGHLGSFEPKRDGIIAKQVGSKMLLEQLEGGRSPSGKGLGSWARFDGRALTGSGGATGSGQAQFGRNLYQVKGSVVHSSFGRKFKSGEMNHENYGEVIASNISRAMVSDKNHVPDVALRHNKGKSEAMVTSRYLQGGLGTLTEVYVKNVGPLPEGQGKHAKIHLDSDKPSGDGVMRLGATSSHDIRRNIALSALMGDHDVNTGNMIMLADGHVGRIDFGHAFNELICGVRGMDKHFGKSGVQHESNRILDFFNRTEVGGMSKKDQRPKLWRDYTGVGPSYDMASALREVAATDAAKASAGVDQAKSQFTELVNNLKDSEDPGDKALLKDVMKSLKQMATNVGKPTTSDNPTEVLNHVFASLEGFIMEGQTQMMEVADLCELQAQIDDFARMSEPGEPIPQAIQDKFNELRQDGSTVRTRDGNGLTWMKTSSLHAPFKGDLTTYIATRRTEIPAEDLQRVGD